MFLAGRNDRAGTACDHIYWQHWNSVCALLCLCTRSTAAQAEQQAWLVLNGEIWRPGGLWSEMTGLRQDGLEVFILMESIRFKYPLYPALMGSFHWEGTMTFLCFSIPLLSVAHLVTRRWQPARLLVCRLSVCQVVCQPARVWIHEWPLVCVAVKSTCVQLCPCFPARQRARWGSIYHEWVCLTTLASSSLLFRVPAAGIPHQQRLWNFPRL